MHTSLTRFVSLALCSHALHLPLLWSLAFVHPSSMHSGLEVPFALCSHALHLPLLWSLVLLHPSSMHSGLARRFVAGAVRPPLSSTGDAARFGMSLD
eukprot:4139027-Prymnesium_polylepis.1